VARLNIYLQAGGDATTGYRAAAEVWGQHPTAITVLQVSAFARPDVLVEVDALAVVPTRAEQLPSRQTAASRDRLGTPC
jgi:2-iminobutanoate/2-iminopropanoate deaminase